MMMGLGPFRFSLDSAAYQEQTRTDGVDWQEQTRIGRKPALQRVGDTLTEIQLKGIIYPDFRGGLAQLEKMRMAANLGPLFIVSGTGRIFGQFVIMSVQENQTIFRSDGTPRKQEFTLFLKEYGADGGI